MQEIQKTVENEAQGVRLRAFDSIYLANKPSRIRYWALGILGALILLLFLPWTQNIRARGTVTTLRQEYRPQEINSIIGGRIVKWYVKEGDFVNAGDTLAQLAEIKDSYLDPELLRRTQEQIKAKEASVTAYGEKAGATGSQMDALATMRSLKVEQLRNKMQQLALRLQADSAEMLAAINDYNIAVAQFRRQRALRDSGLSSLQQLEQRNAALQGALAKRTSAEIKFTNTKTDVINARIEMSNADQEYTEKLFKARGDQAAAQSEVAAGQGELAKLNNQYTNYVIRSGQYFLTAPQRGQVIRVLKEGLNEIIKEGEMLCLIVPPRIEHAVELFVRPIDLPLLRRGQRVRFQFDGYPAIIFSGWPSASYGMFDGRIVAIESAVSTSGKFRVLIAEDSTHKPWPPTLSLGTGAQGIALLKNVPIWYELWRNINGFPPDYYPAKPAADAASKKS